VPLDGARSRAQVARDLSRYGGLGDRAAETTLIAATRISQYGFTASCSTESSAGDARPCSNNFGYGLIRYNGNCLVSGDPGCRAVSNQKGCRSLRNQHGSGGFTFGKNT
jgi:hypothetical protein